MFHHFILLYCIVSLSILFVSVMTHIYSSIITIKFLDTLQPILTILFTGHDSQLMIKIFLSIGETFSCLRS